MPRCRFPACEYNGKFVTKVEIDDPERDEETAFLCKSHSDYILDHRGEEFVGYMFSYNQITVRAEGIDREISKLKELAKQDSHKSFALKEISRLYSNRKALYREKNRISTDICRNPDCKKFISNSDKCIMVTFSFKTPTQTKFRHYLYFHSNECINIFKQQIGLIGEEVILQVSLSKWSK